MHEGHRERMKEKFLAAGLDGFQPHEVLELLLFYAIPRKDTNEIAHCLIDTFGSLSAVFDAPFDLLKKVEGVGDNTALFIKLFPQLCRRYLEDKHDNKDKIISMDLAGQIMLRKFVGRDQEAVILLLLDAKGRQLYCGVVNEGTVNAADIYVRKVVELALMYHASLALISHNHPSGVALPSSSDLEATVCLRDALKLVGVRLLDHIIVADNDYVSLAESGLGEKLFY